MTDKEMESKTGSAGRTGSSHYGLALAVVVCGVLIAAVDTTIVILALPKLEKALHIGVTNVIWVIISYLLVITILATQVGRLGDMFGRVRMYQLGFLVFVVGSLLCGLAANDVSMVVFRVIQGVGGALISANSGAVIADIVPEAERGRAYGFNAIGWNLGAILGILLGGVITTVSSWRWIFLINVPIGLVALALSLKVLHDGGSRRDHRIDWGGTLTLGAGLFCLLWAATRLATSSFDGVVDGFLIAGVLSLGAFVLIEWRVAEPMVDLNLFRIPSMSPSLGSAFLQGLANFSVLFLVIMYLQGVRGLTPLNASLLLVPGYIVGACVGPIGGRLSDRIGPAWPATVGLLIQAVALVVYAQLGVSTSLFLVVIASCISGIGSGAFFPANNASVMRAAPGKSFGIASGMLRTFANVGMVCSFALSVVIAAHAIPRGLAFAIFVGSVSLKPDLAVAFTSGIHAAFIVSIVLVLLGALLSGIRLRTGGGQALTATSTSSG